jgi:two-component system nitrogen regulation sensor histidine kinase NtrY
MLKPWFAAPGLALPGLRWRLGAYLAGLHLLLFGLAVTLYRQSPLLFLGLEALLLLSLALGWRLLRQALEPLSYTRRLHDLLQEQHYSAQLQPSGDAELDLLIGEFNTMLASLYQARMQAGEQQGLLDRLLEATPSAVIVFDFDNRISLLNAAAQALLELVDAPGKPLAAWLPGGLGQSGDAAGANAGAGTGAGAGADDDAASTGGVLRAGLNPGARARCTDLLAQLNALPLGDSQLLADTDGRRYRAQRGQFYDRGFARHFLLVEELTAELEQSEKTTYDKLIRVLAHEVNNTVAATGSVLGSLLYYRTQLAERDGDDFGTAIEAVQRRNASLGEFIERFTRVVKMPAPELRPVPVRDMLDDILYLYREQCRARAIRIEWLRCDDVAPQAMDRQLMEQALLNIVKNALEAVAAVATPEIGNGGGDGGYIRLALLNDEEGPRIAVIDSANLLSQTPQPQLFTPFFSTKKGGQGIGLMFVREVLNRHGFRHRLAAGDPGETRFDIWLGAQ